MTVLMLLLFLAAGKYTHWEARIVYNPKMKGLKEVSL